MTPLTPSTKLQGQAEMSTQLSNQELPSPASTYGQTLVGDDSIPATPGSDQIIESCRTASSRDATDRTDEAHEQFDDGPPYEFEVMLDRCKNASAAVRRGLSLSTCGSSPAKLASMVQDLPVNRHARSSSCFVRDIQDDSDVFGLRNTELTTVTFSGEESTDASAKQDEPADIESVSPRPDKKGHKVTADNAQAHYKPECCIFVANLPTAQHDDVIRRALSDVFFRFGKCFIKLKRDRGMPIAFVQYDNSADADKALGQGAGLFVLGRHCRTERAKAPRCLYVSRRDGVMPTEAEVVDLTKSRGDIEKTWAPSETDQEVHKLAPGFFVRFVYYQDAVDAINALRDIPTYNVEAQQTPRSALALFDPSSILTKPHPNAMMPVFDASMHDSRALWVGELPDTVTKSDLARVFGGPGRKIDFIELRIRSDTSRAGFMSYAFIHYVESSAAYMAASMTHGVLRLFNHRSVKVQYARRRNWRLLGHVSTPIYSHNVACQNMFQHSMVKQNMSQQQVVQNVQNSTTHNSMAYKSMAYNNMAYNNVAYNNVAYNNMTYNNMGYNYMTQNSMVQHNMAYATDCYASPPQNLNMGQIVPASNAHSPSAFYGGSFYNGYPQANSMYGAGFNYGTTYMSGDMNNHYATFPSQLQNFSGNSYVLPQPPTGFAQAPPSFALGNRFYSNE